jgi:hypothetical protein
MGGKFRPLCAGNILYFRNSLSDDRMGLAVITFRRGILTLHIVVGRVSLLIFSTKTEVRIYNSYQNIFGELIFSDNGKVSGTDAGSPRSPCSLGSESEKFLKCSTGAFRGLKPFSSPMAFCGKIPGTDSPTSEQSAKSKVKNQKAKTLGRVGGPN